MKIVYYPETDTLYIEFADSPGESTIEAIEDMVLDVDGDGRPVGLEIEHASEKTDVFKVGVEGITKTAVQDMYQPRRKYRTVMDSVGAAHTAYVDDEPEGIADRESKEQRQEDGDVKSSRQRLLAV